MKAYLLESALLTDEQLEIMAAVLPPERRGRAERLQSPSARRESLAAAYLALYGLVSGETEGEPEYPAVQALLSEAEEVRAFSAAVGWPVGEGGKPFADGVPGKSPRLFVSLSHSEGLAAAAVAHEPLGIDVQRNPSADRERLLRIAGKFHPREREALAALPEAELPGAFCRLWACKESVLKLCGRGLSLPLSCFCIERDDTSKLDGRAIRFDVRTLDKGVFAAAVWAD